VRRDLYRGGRHPGEARGLDDRKPLHLEIDDRHSLPFRQRLEKASEITARFGRVSIRRRQHVALVVQRLGDEVLPRSAAEKVDELVAGNGVHPGSKRLRRIESVALVVHREQRFLYEILYLVRHADQTPPQERTQMRAQVPKEPVIGRSIPREPSNEGLLQLVLAGRQTALSAYSSWRSGRLQTAIAILDGPANYACRRNRLSPIRPRAVAKTRPATSQLLRLRPSSIRKPFFVAHPDDLRAVTEIDSLPNSESFKRQDALSRTTATSSNTRGSVPVRPVDKHLRVFTLGTFSVERDGKAVLLGRRAPPRQLQLLQALVALGETSAAETKLADALWPDAEGDASLHALETTLYRLRRSFGKDAIRVCGRQVGLNHSLWWVDLVAFRSLVSEQR